MLEALNTERRWPGSVVRRFGHLVGVVEAMVGVRAAYFAALLKQRTTAKTTVARLEELVAAWREDAAIAYGKALSAYQRARGDKGSVVPKDEW